LPAALYAVANSSDETRTFSYKIDTDLFGGASCTWQYLRMKPDDEGTWDQWHTPGSVIRPEKGWIRQSRRVTLGPHEIYLLKITPRAT
jgi:hypothetical protein